MIFIFISGNIISFNQDVTASFTFQFILEGQVSVDTFFFLRYLAFAFLGNGINIAPPKDARVCKLMRGVTLAHMCYPMYTEHTAIRARGANKFLQYVCFNK